MARKYNWARCNVNLDPDYYLTSNKWYPIIGKWCKTIDANKFGYCFIIKTDFKARISCLEKRCFHILENDWELSTSINKPN